MTRTWPLYSDHRPIGYTYEAAVHCPDCAEARFGRNDDGFIAEDATDAEGNPVGAFFSWDVDHTDDRATGEHCDDCRAEIVAPWATDAEIEAAAVGYVTAVMWCGVVLAEDGETRSPDEMGLTASESMWTGARETVRDFLSDPAVLSAVRRSEPWRSDAGQIGHDLWLTRERHGSGFWDRGAGDAGDTLTAAAEAMGEGGLVVIDENGRADLD